MERFGVWQMDTSASQLYQLAIKESRLYLLAILGTLPDYRPGTILEVLA